MSDRYYVRLTSHTYVKDIDSHLNDIFIGSTISLEQAFKLSIISLSKINTYLNGSYEHPKSLRIYLDERPVAFALINKIQGKEYSPHKKYSHTWIKYLDKLIHEEWLNEIALDRNELIRRKYKKDPCEFYQRLADSHVQFIKESITSSSFDSDIDDTYRFLYEVERKFGSNNTIVKHLENEIGL